MIKKYKKYPKYNIWIMVILGVVIIGLFSYIMIGMAAKRAEEPAYRAAPYPYYEGKSCEGRLDEIMCEGNRKKVLKCTTCENEGGSCFKAGGMVVGVNREPKLDPTCPAGYECYLGLAPAEDHREQFD